MAYKRTLTRESLSALARALNERYPNIRVEVRTVAWAPLTEFEQHGQLRSAVNRRIRMILREQSVLTEIEKASDELLSEFQIQLYDELAGRNEDGA